MLKFSGFFVDTLMVQSAVLGLASYTKLRLIAGHVISRRAMNANAFILVTSSMTQRLYNVMYNTAYIRPTTLYSAEVADVGPIAIQG